MRDNRHRLSVTLLVLFVLAAGTISVIRLHSIFSGSENPYLIDDATFNNAATRFLVSGELYERHSNNHIAYAAGEAIYKFPPAYQFLVIPFVKFIPDPQLRIKAKYVSYLLIYLASIVLLVCTTTRYFSSRSPDIFLAQACIFLCATAALVSESFFNAFELLEPEIIVFLSVSLAVYFLERNSFWSGAAIAMGTWIKVYPVFLILYFCLRRDYRALKGFITIALLIGFATTMYFGFDENVFYITHILPLIITEPAMPNPQNLTLEAFLVNHGIVHTMDGVITLVLKVMTLLLLAIPGLQASKPANNTGRLLYFGMFISGVLLFASNYWLQYQITLLIPLWTICVKLLTHKRYGFIVAVFLFMLASNLDRQLINPLVHFLIQDINTQAIVIYAQQHPDIDPLLHFSPAAFILFQITEIKVFYPAFLFLVSFFLLRNKYYPVN